MDRENRRKVKLEKDLKSTTAELEARTIEVKSKQNQLMNSDEEYKRCEQQLRETRVGVEVALYTVTCIPMYIY